MRKINQTLTKVAYTALVLPILIACGDKASTEDIAASGDLEAIHARKKDLSDQQKSITAEIALLDSVINSERGLENLPLVTTLQVNKENFEHFIELQGSVTTDQNLLVYPEASGVLNQVLVKEGDRVKKGQVLGIIDDGGLGSQLIQLQTQLDLAKTTYERQERLWNQNIGSEIQYLQAKSAYETQKSAVDQLKSQLGKFKIRAPFSGIIDDVIKDQGTVVGPGAGAEIFRIVNLSDMYIEVSVPENYISTVKKGKKVKVHFPVLNKTVESEVRQTGNYINPNNRSFNVQIAIPNTTGEIKPNMTAKVLINDYTNPEAIMIPQSIISENAQGDQYAYVAANSTGDSTAKAKKVIISTGKSKEGRVEVLSGLDNGVRLIKEGARSVKDGQQVKIIKDWK